MRQLLCGLKQAIALDDPFRTNPNILTKEALQCPLAHTDPVGNLGDACNRAINCDLFDHRSN